jgi:hypothetical protein
MWLALIVVLAIAAIGFGAAALVHITVGGVSAWWRNWAGWRPSVVTESC